MNAILSHELLLAGRRWRSFWLRWAYAAVLLLQLVPLALTARSGGEPYLRFFEAFLVQHFLFLALVTPALTAGALTDEKTRGTLEHLLAAGMHTWEIVLGKLAARVWQLGVLAVIGLPVFCFFGVFADRGQSFAPAVLLVSLLVVFGLASVSLLASVWCRHTRDAVLATYLLALGAVVLAAVTGAADMNPLHAVALDAPAERLARIARFAPAWLGPSALCVLLACWRLRPAYQRQLHQPARVQRWCWLDHPAVYDRCVFWREFHVLGIAPFAWMRRCPRGIGICMIGAAFGTSLFWHWEAHTVHGTMLYHWVPAIILMVMMGAVRSATCVTLERESSTWPDLLATPLSTESILKQKFAGVYCASLLPFLAFFVASAVVVLAVEPDEITARVWLTSLLYVPFALGLACGIGVWCSATLERSWLSLVVACAFCLVMAIPFTVPSILMVMISWAIHEQVGRLMTEPGWDFLVGLTVTAGAFAVSMIVSGVFVFIMVIVALTFAAERIEQTERICPATQRWRQMQVRRRKALRRAEAEPSR